MPLCHFKLLEEEVAGKRWSLRTLSSFCHFVRIFDIFEAIFLKIRWSRNTVLDANRHVLWRFYMAQSIPSWKVNLGYAKYLRSGFCNSLAQCIWYVRALVYCEDPTNLCGGNCYETLEWVSNWHFYKNWVETSEKVILEIFFRPRVIRPPKPTLVR